MNLSRGLFRLWLVLSVVWIGGVAVFGLRLYRAAASQTETASGSAYDPSVMGKFPPVRDGIPNTPGTKGLSYPEFIGSKSPAPAQAPSPPPFDPYKVAGIAPPPPAQVRATSPQSGKIDPWAEFGGPPSTAQTETTNRISRENFWRENGALLLALALAPPGLLISLGVALRWVACGFRQ